MTKINEIKGAGDKTSEQLAAVGITTVEALLKAGKGKKDRKELSEKAGIAGKKLLELLNRADLFRIKGISTQYSNLLEGAGVDTVPELAQRKPENLHAKMAEVNAEKKHVKQLPSVKMVTDWVAQAKDLPREIEY